jgi:hypothetical protein
MSGSINDSSLISEPLIEIHLIYQFFKLGIERTVPEEDIADAPRRVRSAVQVTWRDSRVYREPQVVSCFLSKCRTFDTSVIIINNNAS